MQSIPSDLKKRIPLIRVEHLDMLFRLQEHEYAPRWNYTCGDRITESDLEIINQFEKQIVSDRDKRFLQPSEKILDWVDEVIPRVSLFRRNSEGISIRNEFGKINCTSRKDLALNLSELVPEEISLDRIIVNTTSGTTGHSIKVPSRPDAIGCNSPLMMFALNQNGVFPKFEKDKMGCILVCYQETTAVYNTVTPMLNGCGFAKINLHPNSWKNIDHAKKFIEELQPQILTGDPISFSELLKLDLNYSPKALVSTAMEMNSVLKKTLEEKLNTIVVDFFSANDTGPIFYKCKQNEFHLLPTDVHLEITNESGECLGEGMFGEITLTGGRNPFVPMLRYKTNDFGKLDLSACTCGDFMPRVLELQTRKAVLYFNEDNQRINPVDIARVIKNFPVLQFSFLQKKDKTCILSLKPFAILSDLELEKIKTEIKKLFFNKIQLSIKTDLIAKDKLISFQSEMN
jgi:phenylacetate-CoA ligase